MVKKMIEICFGFWQSLVITYGLIMAVAAHLLMIKIIWDKIKEL